MRRAATLLCLIFSRALFCQTPPVLPVALRPIRGVTVHFQKDTLPEERDRLHDALGASRVARLTSVEIDVALPRKSRGTMTEEEARLLCQRYRASPLVQSCEPDHEAFPLQDEPGHALIDDILDKTTRESENQAPTPACPISDYPPGILPELVARGATPFWDREAIGADLAKEFLAGLKNLPEVDVGMIDGGFRLAALRGQLTARLAHETEGQSEISRSHPGPDDATHGTGVAQVLGPEKYGVSPVARFDSLLPALDEAEIIDALAKLGQSHVKLVNFSETAGGSDEVFHGFQNLAKNAIPVLSAGNAFPFSADRNLYRVPGIIVGSVDPYGHLSAFSNLPETTTILAPSDDAQIYHSSDRRFEQLGGTSGAAPLVTGTLANAIAILGPVTPAMAPELTWQEATTLLKKTALPWGEVGMLDSYRLVRVAKRLKEAGWPADRAHLINQASLYDFTTEATQLLSDARKIIARLDEKKAKNTPLSPADCADRRQAANLLRKVFLLVTDGETRKGNGKGAPLYQAAHDLLASLYKDAGFPANAQFYRNFDNSALADETQDTIRSPDRETGTRLAALRTAGLVPNGRHLVDLGLQSGDPQLEEWAVVMGLTLYPDPVAFLTEVLHRNGTGINRAVGLAASGLPKESNQIDLFRHILESSSESAAAKANALDALTAYAATFDDTTKLEPTLALLRKAFISSDAVLRAGAAQALGTVGSPRALNRVRNLVFQPALQGRKLPDPPAEAMRTPQALGVLHTLQTALPGEKIVAVRSAIVIAAGKFGAASAPLLAGVIHDEKENELVKIAAITAIGNNTIAEGIPLLREMANSPHFAVQDAIFGAIHDLDHAKINLAGLGQEGIELLRRYPDLYVKERHPRAYELSTVRNAAESLRHVLEAQLRRSSPP